MDTSRTTPSLSAEHVSIGYQTKGRTNTTVASDLNLQLNPGELVCLLGPNGAGKSTLIRALSGMTQPLSGTIRINNCPLGTLSPRERAREISVVLTDSMSIGMLSVYSLVALGRHPHTLSLIHI